MGTGYGKQREELAQIGAKLTRALDKATLKDRQRGTTARPG